MWVHCPFAWQALCLVQKLLTHCLQDWLISIITACHRAAWQSPASTTNCCPAGGSAGGEGGAGARRPAGGAGKPRKGLRGAQHVQEEGSVCNSVASAASRAVSPLSRRRWSGSGPHVPLPRAAAGWIELAGEGPGPTAWFSMRMPPAHVEAEVAFKFVVG